MVERDPGSQEPEAIIANGISTDGLDAIRTALGGLPAGLEAPVVVIDGRLQLRRTERVTFARPPIDVLFASVAMGREPSGVILSGNGRDGARGLQAIKAGGGTTIVQDPRDLPRAAIAGHGTDFTVPLDEIAPTILALMSRRRDAASEGRVSGEVEPGSRYHWMTSSSRLTLEAEAPGGPRGSAERWPQPGPRWDTSEAGVPRALPHGPVALGLHRQAGGPAWTVDGRRGRETMGLKDVLVHVDNDPTCSTRLDVAVTLAVTHGAHLVGLHVMGEPWLPLHVAVEVPPDFQEQQRRHFSEQARRAETRFRERAERDGIADEWRLAEGDIVGTVQLHARYADLTIVGQALDLETAPAELRLLPEELVLGVGRPVVIVPRYGTFERVGTRVLVAWNGSREATRAIHDAMPILKRATKVTVLSIDPAGKAVRRLPSADIALHLARHGVVAEADSTPSLDLAVGDILLSRAFDMGVDLIVMGAYGHSRVREMVLGGATRALLQQMTVPVLMSH